MTSEQFGHRIGACHHCRRNLDTSKQGVFSCRISGKNIIEHGRGLECPDVWDHFGNPPAQIPTDYEPTPANATKGRCCS